MNRALQWKLIAGFMLVFFAGGITGAFLGGVYARHFFFDFHHPELIGPRIKERLRTELDLTPEQVAKISPVIDKTAAQLQQVRRDTGQRVHEIMTEAHRQMATNLTQGQREKLQQLAKRHRRWHGHPLPRETTPELPVSPPQNSPPGEGSK
jgi:Spy/CpxP family protein refolding chaperone